MKISSKWLLTALLAAHSMGMAFADGSYGLPAEIQQGNILHCFNWTMAEVKAELPNIAAAGYGSVQLSPLQRSDVQRGTEWHALYRPYDLAFKSSGMGSEADLKSLCDEAAKYGIKVIVDVVANHVDRTSGYHDTWWDQNGRVRWNGGINFGDRYSITHGQLGDYGDVNSEDPEVIARAKAYVEKLKSLGVKGIRWDAAKHIGLPSEGCNFWSSVTSVPGIWHYGEILDNPGPNAGIIKEYAQYISVTDNKYSDGAAKDNGGLPFGYGGSWVVDHGVPDTKIVYWGESHDTYSNNNGWSKYADQGTIDRAYAAMACRQGATCLYLARPDARDFNSIRVGKGSNTSYKSKAISEVNKFRNAMVGKPDYFTSSGNAISVTRQGGGAVIVMKGSGNVSIANGGGYCPAGTYTDKVSGNTFTVTGTTITGNVGSSGIAVIYNGTTPTPDPNPNPNPDPDPQPNPDNTVYFDNSSSNWGAVYCYAWSAGATDQNSPWPGEPMTLVGNNIYSYTGRTSHANVIFTNGSGTQTADLQWVSGHIYKADGSHEQYTVALEEVLADSGVAPEYYNLQGVRISTPQPGTIVIVRRGSNVSKQLYR
ncbi:MAG: starch-binding protein [Muribaculaceae bacterium]|nr:starch-binding protein [Muribaculaceae bacterium]